MKKFFLISSALLSLTSCSLDDNLSENYPLIDSVSPSGQLANAQVSTYDASVTDIMELSNIWLNTWAGNEYYFAAPMNTEYQLNITTGFRNGIWNDNYKAMRNLANIIKHPQAANYSHHAAVAKILMANSMQYMVDFYGDVPYSEAFSANEGIKTPKYDKGEDVYKALVEQINEALVALDAPAAASLTENGGDVILHGDTDKWIRLGNTIKLRLLLRQSKVTDATVKSFVEAQLATLVGAEFVNSDITINPGYSAANASQQNPLHREYGWLTFDDTANNTYGYRYIHLADHFAKLLNGEDANTTGVADARRGSMYRAVGGTLKGIVQGGGKVTGGTEAGFSRLGWRYYNYSSVSSSLDGYIMVKSESDLLQAEAAVLYPTIFSTIDAEAKYKDAVQATYDFFKVTADPSVYLANLDTKPYGWNGSKGKIAAIQYQRMVALNLLKPQETYINYLKTGYPETPLALTATQASKPWRLLYPSREYQTNTANVPNITQADIFVKNQYTPFWNRN